MGYRTVVAFVELCVCFSSIPVALSASVCFGDLGCFHSYSGIPLPWSPSAIATKFQLHVRGTSTVPKLSAVGFTSHISSWVSHFDASKKTKVISHGYLDNGAKTWITTMTSALLKKVCVSKIQMLEVCV